MSERHLKREQKGASKKHCVGCNIQEVYVLKGHTRVRGCKPGRAQTGLCASGGRKSSPCEDRSRGGEETGSLCTTHRSAGKTSDTARGEHCVSGRQTTTTTEKRCGIWERTRKRYECWAFRPRTNSDDARPSPIMDDWNTRRAFHSNGLVLIC